MQGICEKCQKKETCNKYIGKMYGYCSTDFLPIGNYYRVKIYQKNYYFRANSHKAVYEWLINKGIADCEIKDIEMIKQEPNKYKKLN